MSNCISKVIILGDECRIHSILDILQYQSINKQNKSEVYFHRGSFFTELEYFSHSIPKETCAMTKVCGTLLVWEWEPGLPKWTKFPLDNKTKNFHSCDTFNFSVFCCTLFFAIRGSLFLLFALQSQLPKKTC